MTATRRPDGERDNPHTHCDPGTGSGAHSVETVDDAHLPRVFRLAPSVEPGVVFTSMAAQVVPDLCDGCTVDIVDSDDGAAARYRIAYPPRTASVGGLLRIADRAAADPDHRVRVPFAHPSPADAPGLFDAVTAPTDGFCGQVVFVWHLRLPTSTDRTLAARLVHEAVQTVMWQRTEQAARVAVADAAQLRTALHARRHLGQAIGIVMHQHELTQPQALDLLRAASRTRNRTLCELASDVVDIRRLDPALVDTRHAGSPSADRE